MDANTKTAVLRQQYAMGSRQAQLYNYSDSDVASYVNTFADNLQAYDVNSDASTAISVGTKWTGQSFTPRSQSQIMDHIDVKTTKVGNGAKLQLKVYDSPARTKLLTMRTMSTAELATGYNWSNFYFPVIPLVAGQLYYFKIEQLGTFDVNNRYAFLANNGSNYSGGDFYDTQVKNSSVDLGFRVGTDLSYERDLSLLIEWRKDAQDAYNNVNAQKLVGDTYAK